MKSIVIAVVNAKGGIGKTTTVINLAHALTRHDKRVLCIDADPQCNTTSILLPRSTPVRAGLYQVLDPDAGDGVKVRDCIYSSKFYSNLFCLPNTPDTATLEFRIVSKGQDPYYLLRNRVREYVLQNFDITLIDCPPNMGTFVWLALVASDCVIIPNEIDSFFSLDGLIKALRLIEEVRATHNPDLRFLRLLVNKVDKRTSISKVAIEQLRASFKPDQVFETTVPINVDFKMAERRGETVLRYKSAAPGAKAFRALALEALHILEELQDGEAKAPASWL